MITVVVVIALLFQSLHCVDRIIPMAVIVVVTASLIMFPMIAKVTVVVIAVDMKVA